VINLNSTSPAFLFLGSFQQFGYQLVGFIPKLLAALIIWVIGKYLLHMGISALERIRLDKAKGLNKVLDSFTFILLPLGKLILFLVVLDYLGIGRTVIDAFLSGLSFAVAIALGLAFGKALEPDAKELVDNFKKQLEK
jgi:small conductance mechanosensitive channel